MFVGSKHTHGLNLGGCEVAGNYVEPGADINGVLFGGYRITEVDSDRFARWLEHNGEAAMVENKIILWNEDRNALIGQCRGNARVSNGMYGAGRSTPR